jgi:hypothetical protein
VRKLLDVNGQRGSGFERLHTQADLSHSSLAAGLKMVDHIAGTGILLQIFLEGGDKRFPSLLRQKPTSVFILLEWSSISVAYLTMRSM